ncbi:uncharacterized protein BXZ73DRAFT_74716 [Epithele typhae]|uniref:uncharacterized protein n=1 Tax=Epithele typhae TaxID=378194 RepID=UPI002008C579|nr:uncharacterized protein BXZ73DRAFT_74716 [Epithele typhae]KAH9942462.1 hypothetical protein BXZ73DRAFT_74716 [Epithele typhae]
MAGQVFALLVGIDKYQSSTTWNLNAAVDDARSVQNWLINDLQVPRSNICTLLDGHATKHNIEEKFTSHLVNNAAIEPGDAIIFYFAGHGSSIRAPAGWFDRGRGDVPVLCTHDYDTKLPKGHANAGISDRSLHAMLHDLSRVKGDNITLILDTCFCLPPTDGQEPKERHYTRYTPACRATSEDLLAGLWPSASPQKAEPMKNRGFTGITSDSHVVLAASSTGWAATERKDGGNLTRALLSLKDARPIHKFTYSDLPSELAPYMGDHQYAAVAGDNVDRVLFDGVPFARDTRFVAATPHDHERMQVDAGEIQGISEGTELGLYPHNCRGSLNTPLGTYLVTEVYPTWCLAKPKSPAKHPLREGWARVARWNAPTPPLARRAADKLRPSVLRVRDTADADASVSLGCHELTVQRRDALVSTHCRGTLHLPSAGTRSDLKTVEAAARFHMHLYRRHPARPFKDAVGMELYRLDPATWTRASANLLVKGRARIVESAASTPGSGSGVAAGEKGGEPAGSAIYAVVLRNDSDADLWPYLAYMDAGGYSIALVYHPDPGGAPPLRAHSRMVIGSGATESEALSFALADGADSGAGFLKLFLSTTYTPMTVLEQGTATGSGPVESLYGPGSKSRTMKIVPDSTKWDSVLASITVVRTST